MGRKGSKVDGPDGMKACYRNAKESGDREEEARWANQIGHAYKDSGDYVEALTWFRLDYDISVKRQDEGLPLNLMPTCQCLGEIYHRLGDYSEALHYEERHMELAVGANNLVEQQRAYTQLGRTYMDMFELNDDILALPKAKQYLSKAMELAKKLKANPVPGSSNFVVELVDAYNNLGTLKMITDEPLEARRLLNRGLRICGEEEVGQYDAARTRVHHNLGRLHAERRQWSAAMTHILKDIEICRALPHPQGEVKGLINLGDIHFKQRHYEDSMNCYNLALGIVRKLQDEDILMKTVEANKTVVEAAIPKLAVFNQHLAKHEEMQRLVEAARGTASERSLCLQEFKFLKEIIGKAYELQYWEEHLRLAKRLKKVVVALGDQEKLGDALDVIGESYSNLCNYEKAKKWHYKSFKVCERVHHEEGQAVALINYGNSLDSSGNYKGALKAYKQAYVILKQIGDSHHLDLKISALNNMHYCYAVRFDNSSDARIVEAKINRLKQLKKDPEIEEDPDDVCSETDDETERNTETQVMDVDDEVLPHPWTPSPGNARSTRIPDPEKISENRTGVARRSQPPDVRKRSRIVVSDEETEESAGAVLPSPPKRKSSRSGVKSISAPKGHPPSGQTPKISACETLNLSSDDDDDDEPLESIRLSCKAAAIKKSTPPKHSLTKDKDIQHRNVNPPNNNKIRSSSSARCCGVVQPNPERSNINEDESWTSSRILDAGKASRRKDEDLDGESQPEDLVERCGNDGAGDMRNVLASRHPARGSPGSRGDARKSTSSHHNGAASHNSDTQAPSTLTQAPLIVPVNINGQSLRVIIRHSELGSKNTIGWLMEEIIRLYTCDSTTAKKPVVQRLEFKGSILKPVQIIEEVLIDLTSDDSVDAIIQGWVAIPVVERYEAHCVAASTCVNPALLQKLKLLKGSCEEVDASNCDLLDVSVRPLIDALQENDALSSLDLSHNLLGNASMNAIQEMIATTNQGDLGLTLDLHMNQLGAGALMQIAKCNVTLSRLEVLKLSGNRLTDAAGRNLAAILTQSKGLATLEIERCGLTSRSIQQISSSLRPESSLVKLCIGHNNPIGGSALSILVQKLSGLLSFTELDLSGIELDEKGVLAATLLMKSSSSLSILNMAGCEVQNHGAQVLCRALKGTNVQLLNIDISSWGLSREPALEICQQMTFIYGLSALNLSNNQLNEQASELLSFALSQGGWRLKSLCLDNCCIGLSGVLHLLQSLQGNTFLWELHMSENLGLAGTKLRAADPELEPPRNADICNHATEHVPLASDPALNEDQPLGGPHLDSTHLVNHESDLTFRSPESGLRAAVGGDMEQPATVCPSGQKAQVVVDNTNLLGKEIPLQQNDLNDFNLHSGHLDLLNETTQLDDDFLDIFDGGREVPVSDSEADGHAIEEFVVRIRAARGLQCLNLTGNGLIGENLNLLWNAWCHGGRAAKREFPGKAHFVMQDGRECTALITSCFTCQV